MNGLDALPYSTQPTASDDAAACAWEHPEAHVSEGDCLVFAGDALARLTWNFYPSLLHRPSVQLMVDGGGGEHPPHTHTCAAPATGCFPRGSNSPAAKTAATIVSPEFAYPSTTLQPPPTPQR
jgi:hypothetical protein